MPASIHMSKKELEDLIQVGKAAGMINEGFFDDLQDEIACELRLMETEEAEVERVSGRIEELYRQLHPSDYLRTIPGIGVRTAQVFLAIIGDPHRFRSQAAFANWTGVVPGARQSAGMEGKGLRSFNHQYLLNKLMKYYLSTRLDKVASVNVVKISS